MLVQSTLGFATMDIAANLYLAIARALTDLRQDINSDLKFWPLCSKIATVEVVIPNGLEQKLFLATTSALTDLRQYINSDLVFSNLKF